jgi:hypothetical protein
MEADPEEEHVYRPAIAPAQAAGHGDAVRRWVSIALFGRRQQFFPTLLLVIVPRPAKACLNLSPL